MSEIAELLERYRLGTVLVTDALSGATEEELDFKPGPDKWSTRYIVAHLADTEATSVVRLRQILAEDNPTIIPWNQDAWAARTDYEKRKPTQSLATLRQLRSDNYELLKDLPEEAWSRTGKHLERGVMTVLDFLRIFARHAEAHAEQIRNVRAAYRERRSQ